MKSGHSCRGSALLDGLIALVLFGVVLLMSLAALLRGMHSMHDAVLTGTAVDFAAELLEARRAQPAGEPFAPLLDDWITRLTSALPADSAATAQMLVQPLLAEATGTAP